VCPSTRYKEKVCSVEKREEVLVACDERMARSLQHWGEQGVSEDGLRVCEHFRTVNFSGPLPIPRSDIRLEADLKMSGQHPMEVRGTQELREDTNGHHHFFFFFRPDDLPRRDRAQLHILTNAAFKNGNTNYWCQQAINGRASARRAVREKANLAPEFAPASISSAKPQRVEPDGWSG